MKRVGVDIGSSVVGANKIRNPQAVSLALSRALQEAEASKYGFILPASFRSRVCRGHVRRAALMFDWRLFRRLGTEAREGARNARAATHQPGVVASRGGWCLAGNFEGLRWRVSAAVQRAWLQTLGVVLGCGDVIHPTPSPALGSLG